MKKLLQLQFISFLLFFLSGCGYHSVPPEVIAINNYKPKPSFPICTKGELIILDAGHGGKDAGAASEKDGYEEKELTLKTTFLVEKYLKQLGYTTLLTREDDSYVALDNRADIANSVKADLFVSIHYNYSDNQEAEGIEVYYFKEAKSPASQRIIESKKLGREVLKQIVEKAGAHPRGVKQANFAVIRETKMPAILVEAGFLSNPQERKNIKDMKYLRMLARGIAQGIDQYLESNR